MLYRDYYDTPIVGRLTILANEDALEGLWFNGQAHYGAHYDLSQVQQQSNPVLDTTKRWLDRYFAGEQPAVTELSLAPRGTDFQLKVLHVLCEIPYGQSMSYQDVADAVTQENGGHRSSARAVGGAVGHNPISIIIPCHRVLGKDGALTGYAAGVDKKIELMKLENMILI